MCKLQLHKAEESFSVIVCPNLTSIWHLSVEKDVNIYEIVIDSDGEQNSAPFELIFVYLKLDFDEVLRQKRVFRGSRKCFKYPLQSD